MSATSGYTLLSVLAAGALFLGCRMAPPVGAVTPIEGVRNPSVHILFDTTRALPLSGTFGWGISMLRVDPAHTVLLSDVEERMHLALHGVLLAKGFAYTNRAPDYLVSFAFLSGASLSETELNEAYGDLLAFPARQGTTAALNYSDGVLILDVVERAQGHLLWRGAIKADIDMDLPDDRKQARCDGAVRELLRHYPNPTYSR